jgi:glycosyltransferase involved in cell wall biosynthesis
MLTACMIVHNEARVLARCLDSIAPFVDECCVVDSGSEDGTVEIAERFGAQVVVDRTLADEQGRMRDFSVARNRALSMAREGAWVLSIDADEVLIVRRRSALQRLLRTGSIHAIELPIESSGMRWYLPRLFRKMPWSAWQERVHEWIDIRGPVRRTASVAIRNRPDKRGKESAAERDLRLCAEQLREAPDNLRAVLYLARALRHAERYEEAIPLYQRYWRESDFGPGRHTAMLGAAMCALLLRDYASARRYGLSAYRLDPRLAEACCIVGDACLGAQRPDLAEGWFRRALEKPLPGSDYPYFVDRDSYGRFPRQRLRWIAARARGVALESS